MAYDHNGHSTGSRFTMVSVAVSIPIWLTFQRGASADILADDFAGRALTGAPI